MLAILGAMQEEVQLITSSFVSPRETTLMGRQFMHGELFGVQAVVAFSRWGKVAAAATTAAAISHFQVGSVIFSGVAGALSPACRIGDIIVATDLIQHDLDARPLFDQFEIPLTGVRNVRADDRLRNALVRAAKRFVSNGMSDIPLRTLRDFGIDTPSVLEGLIVSGDRFVANAAAVRELQSAVPDALCVEMEGAAVAQVCSEAGVPFGVLRTISDTADHTAVTDFPRFVSLLASKFSFGIIREYILEGVSDGQEGH